MQDVRRADGTILTQDCPVGIAAVRRRMALAVAAWLTLLIGAMQRTGLAPEEHAAVIDREETKWSALIKSIGLKPE